MQRYLYNLATDKINGFLPAVFKFLLFLLSLVYGLIVGFILLLYKLKILRKFYADCAVISVGNVTLGGTGKTPLVELIAKDLSQKGIKTAILTRGYKRGASLENIADEASMLKEKLDNVPVLVGANRIANAKKAVTDYHAKVILLDDGFQHWKLHRDLDIVVVDSTNPFGNERLIPRGILREPLSSLNRADIFLLTKTDYGRNNLEMIKTTIRNLKPDAQLFESNHIAKTFYNIKDNRELEISDITNKNVCLLASIGDVDAFEKMVAGLGLSPNLKFYFLDHYQYKKKDLDNVVKACLDSGITSIITTEKDIPRIKDINFDFPNNISVLALKIEIKFLENEDVFFKRLYTVCNR